MSAVALPFIQNTPEWVDARRNFVGSSDIPVLTGNSPYATSALELWAYKTRRPDGTFLLDPEPPDAETQELFDLGHALEPVIADRCAIMHGEVRRKRQMQQHPDIPWAAASLDRQRAPRQIVEVKWVPNRSWRGGAEPVPSYVQDQVQWQLFVTGWDHAHVAVLHGSHVECHDVEPDRTYQDNLLTIASDFHDNYVVPGVMPPIDGSEATRRTLVRMYPRDTLGFAEPTAELEALARAERAAAKAKDAAEGEYDRIRNVLRAMLTEHAGAEDEDWRISFRKNADGKAVQWKEAFEELGIAVDMVRAAHPELELVDPGEVQLMFTQPREGARPLVVKVRDEASGKWV